MYNHLFPAAQRIVDNKKVIYFDAACSYLKYQTVIDSISRYYTEYSCCSGDRESSYLGSRLHQEIQDTRKEISSFLGADKDDFIIFTSGTTGGINSLFGSLDVSLINSVIVSDIEHNSHYLPAYEWASRYEKELIVIPYEDFFSPDKLDIVFSNLKPPFLLCLTHMSNITGVEFDISSISDLVHRYKSFISIDDAQYIPHHREFVKENGVDFIHFSAHKLGGPTGIGVTFIKKDSASILAYSTKIGGGTVKKIEDFRPLYKHFPYKLEGGVQDFAGILGLRSVVQQIEKIGYENIQTYIGSLYDYFWHQYYKNGYDKYFIIISKKNSNIITLSPHSFSVIDFHQYLNYYSEGFIVAFRTGTFCADNYVNSYILNSNIMRISFGIYNSAFEIDSFFGLLETFIKTYE